MNQQFEKIKSALSINLEQQENSLINFIETYMKKLKRNGVIFGLSGGLDSAVIAALCQKAVGCKKTFALIMPESDSIKENTQDAINFATQLGIKYKLINLTPYLKKFGIYKLFPLNWLPLNKKLKENLSKKAYQFFQKKTGLTPFSESLNGFDNKKFSFILKNTNAYYRIKHRLRAILLYFYGERENLLVVGTANKSEYLTGFFVKGGCDHIADIMPLLNLYKTQVKLLAEYLQIPLKIREKSPSPDLLPGLTDEEVLGISYEKLDLILKALELNWEISEIVQVLNIPLQKVNLVVELVEKSEHFRKVYTP